MFFTRIQRVTDEIKSYNKNVNKREIYCVGSSPSGIPNNIAYKTQRNCVNSLIRNAKRSFCLQTIDGNINNPKEMWRNIDIVVGRRGRYSKTTFNNTIFLAIFSEIG